MTGASRARAVTNDDKAFAQAHLHGEVLWANWVSKKHKREKGKIEQRLLVIGRYRVLTAAKAVVGRSVKREAHLFQLRRVFAEDPTGLALFFVGGDDKAEDWHIEIASDPTDVCAIIEKLGTAYQTITYGWPEKALVAWDMPEDMKPPTLRQPPARLGFDATYLAACDFFRLGHQGQALLDSLDDDQRDLVLSDLDFVANPEAGSKSNKWTALDFRPLGLVLRFNRYFKGLRLSSSDIAPSKSFFSELGEVVSHSEVLTTLEVTSFPTSVNPEPLCRSLSKVSATLTELDLSGCPLKDEALHSFCISLRSLRLVALDLSRCHLAPKGVSAVAGALMENDTMGSSLGAFNLSYNKIAGDGAFGLGNWLQMDKCRGLKTLLLSQTAVDVNTLFAALCQSPTSLMILDISGSKITTNSINQIVQYVSSSTSLLDLDVEQCQLKDEVARSLVRSLVANEKLPQVLINLAHNDLGPAAIANICPSFVVNSRCNIHTLSLDDTGLRAKGLEELCLVIPQMTSLRRLQVSRSVKLKDKGLREALGKFADYFGSPSCSVEALQFAGSDGNFVGKDMHVLFEGLQRNNSLTELDITGQRAGSESLRVLGEALACHKKLNSLLWDDNRLTAASASECVRHIKNNTHLHLETVSYPMRDIARLKADGKELILIMNDLFTFLGIAAPVVSRRALSVSSSSGGRFRRQSSSSSISSTSVKARSFSTASKVSRSLSQSSSLSVIEEKSGGQTEAPVVATPAPAAPVANPTGDDFLHSPPSPTTSPRSMSVVKPPEFLRSPSDADVRPPLTTMPPRHGSGRRAPVTLDTNQILKMAEAVEEEAESQGEAQDHAEPPQEQAEPPQEQAEPPQEQAEPLQEQAEPPQEQAEPPQEQAEPLQEQAEAAPPMDLPPPPDHIDLPPAPPPPALLSIDLGDPRNKRNAREQRRMTVRVEDLLKGADLYNTPASDVRAASMRIRPLSVLMQPPAPPPPGPDQ